MQCEADFLHRNGCLYCTLEKGHDGLHMNDSSSNGITYNTVWGRVPKEAFQPGVEADANYRCGLCDKVMPYNYGCCEDCAEKRTA